MTKNNVKALELNDKSQPYFYKVTYAVPSYFIGDKILFLAARYGSDNKYYTGDSDLHYHFIYY